MPNTLKKVFMGFEGSPLSDDSYPGQIGLRPKFGKAAPETWSLRVENQNKLGLMRQPAPEGRRSNCLFSEWARLDYQAAVVTTKAALLLERDGHVRSGRIQHRIQLSFEDTIHLDHCVVADAIHEIRGGQCERGGA